MSELSKEKTVWRRCTHCPEQLKGSTKQCDICKNAICANCTSANCGLIGKH